MNLNRINSQKGIAQFLVIAVMAFLALGIPVTTKLVQQNQENRSKATEQTNFSCNTLRDVHKNFFDICKDFDNICFNKLNGEYQGCGNIAENNGGDCTDPNQNMNSASNILCPINSETSLSCDTLYTQKQKYFATCALNRSIGVCFDKTTGEYLGCDNEDNCKNANIKLNSDNLNKIFCSVKEEDSQLWTSQAGMCGTESAKTLEVVPSDNFCLHGNPSRFYFDQNDNRYYWRCGDVEKLGNQAAICYATITGIPGSSKITLDRKEISLGVGQTIKINATLTPPDPTDKITWTTNMPDFFSVDSNGIVKTLKVGGAGNITAMTSKGQGASLRANTSSYSERIDAKCGSAHNKTFPSIPENYLCEQSSAGYGQLKGNTFYWTCSGENGGSSANCEATINNNVIPSPTKTTPTPPPIKPGAYLYFNPQNQNHKIGNTVKIVIGVNSNNIKVGGVDAIGTYDSSKLELISIDKSPSMVFGDKGDCVISKDLISSKFSLSCFANDSSQAIAAKGDLVNLTFKTKSTGSAKIEFICEQNNLSDSNIVNSNPPKDIIVCNKNINANIVIAGGPTIIDGVCGNVKYNQLSKNSATDKKITLCKSGKMDDFFTVYENPNSTDLTYVWNCLGSNGGSNIQCDVADPNMIIDGICGKAKYDELTVTSDKNRPKLLCESGFVENFVKTTPKCLTASNCPPSVYSWICVNIRNGGKGVKCSVKQGSGSTNTPTPRPITTIKINPTSLRLKIGQSQNLTYILTPSNSTDTVKWSTTGDGQVKIQKITFKCAIGSGSKCIDAPGNNHLQVTALKAGTVKIKLTTSGNISAEATVVISGNESAEIVNGSCGTVKYSNLTTNTNKENPKLLCKTGNVSEYSKMTPNCMTSSNCPPAFYSWKCLGSNGGKSVKCSIKSPSTYSYTIPATGIKVNPTSLKLKVGQTAKISYVLTPQDTTNPVYSSIVGPKDLVKVTQTTPPCPSGANCALAAPGIQYYNVTALKSGSVKIYFRTSSGKSASSTILINK